jgi:hypothetical protein
LFLVCRWHLLLGRRVRTWGCRLFGFGLVETRSGRVDAGIGQRTKQDMAILSIEVMLEIQQLNEEQLTVALEQVDLTRMRMVAEWGCCTAYAFCHAACKVMRL